MQASLKFLVFLALFLTNSAWSQTVHTVLVLDDFFDPEVLDIQPGDIVRWENPAGGAPHDLVSETNAWDSPPLSSEWVWEVRFDDPGTYDYFCTPHRLAGMVGQINVLGSEFEMDAGLNGNWWNGPARNGEGAQIEISDGGNGTQTLVATLYSYDTQGNQIFLVAVGTVNGSSADVEVFITEGGQWGNDFDPAQVSELQWGTGTFSASSCSAMELSLTPNSQFQSLGYSSISYDLVRLTNPIGPCPLGQLGQTEGAE